MLVRQPRTSSLDGEKEIPIRRSSARLRFGLTVFTLLCAGTPSFAELGHPSDDARRYVWDLTSLFPDDASWETERAAVTEKLKTFGRLKGTLGRDAKSLAEALDEIAALRRRAGRLELYSTLRSDADVKSERATMMAAAGPALANQVDAAVAFAGVEILGIGGGRVAEWLKAEPRLNIHRRRINRVLREASHSANPETLALLGDLGDWPEGLARTYWALQECDLPWPTMKGADGKDLTIDNAAFLRLRNATDSVERRTATELFLRRLAPLENVFGSLLTRRIEADATIARHRRFRDGIEAQLFREGLPSGAHRTMLDVVHANLPVLHRYLRLRARALGLEHLTFDAIRVPPATDNRNISIEESLANIIAASEPLGPEFQARLRERLAKPWAHLPPSPVKRETYEIFPRVGGSEPFGLMTFRGDLLSSRSLAGLATLLVTFAAVPPERSFDRWSEDTGIYSNAVLEAGRFLHDDYAIDHAPDTRDRIAALMNSLDSLGGAFFRYAMISEFESRVQESMLKGEVPTGARLSEIYLELLRRYYGHDEGVVSVDEMFAREWISYRVPFLSFETLNFPLAAAAAAQLIEKARKGDADTRDGFLHLLGRGEIDLSYPLLKRAGADLATDGPYRAVARRMNSLMNELERTLDHKK